MSRQIIPEPFMKIDENHFEIQPHKVRKGIAQKPF